MTTEREELKRAIKRIESGISFPSEAANKVLSVAKAYLETLPDQDPLDWMEEGQVVEVWDTGWDKEHKDIRKFSSLSSSGGIVVGGGFDIGDIHYENWRLPESRAITHNGNGQNPCPGRKVVRRYNGFINKHSESNKVDWTRHCEFIILPEGW